VRLETFSSSDHHGLEEMIRSFLPDGHGGIRRAGFGVAGPVRDGRSLSVNLAWEIDANSVAEAFDFEHVALINDLDANARGLAALCDEDFAVLCPGTPDPTGNGAVLSAGTGLGQALLAREGTGFHVVPGEGGHVDFAPTNDLEIELWHHLHTRFGHVSYERILSGQGIENLYRFVIETGRGEPLPPFEHGEPAAVEISGAGLDGSSPGCALVLDLFASIYGAAAGNVALTVMATGGVFLGGGIAPKLREKLADGTFLDSFRAKGRFAPILHDIPVKIVLNDKAALIGAGLAANEGASE
jgi:glucokinase